MRKEMIAPVSPEEFKFAVGVCTAAAAMKGPYTNPKQFGFSILDDKNGAVTEYRLTDIAMARGILAVREQFEDDDKCIALMMRINGFMRLLDDQRMKTFVRGSGEPIEIREEVFEVAAVEKMSHRGGFSAQKFFRKVEALVVNRAASDATPTVHP
jgi:hypothetical protein